MKFTVAALASALLTVVSAQGTGILQVTSPIQNAKFTAGRVANITWINPTQPTISQIELANGDSNNLNHLGVIASNVDSKSGSYAWHIPSNTTAGTYALIFGTPPDVAYSPQFEIAAEGSGGDSQQGGDQQQSGGQQ